MAQKRPIEQITIDDSDDEGVNNQQVLSAVNVARGSDDVELQDELEETEQQQLAQAIALSLLDTTVVNPHTAAPASASQKPPLTDRQLDEKARLERQREWEKKHNASNGRIRAAGPSPIAAPAPPAPKRSRPNVVTFSDLPRNNVPNIPSNATASTSRTFIPPVETTRKQSNRFWEGAIRRVHNVLAQPDTFGESFTFAQLVAADQKLEMAIVGSYCLELEWVCSHFKADTPVMLFRARHSDDHPARYQKVDDLIKPQTFLILPEERSLPGPWKGTMHTKLLMFYYKSFCRIVIPTANCVEHDWSIIDNAFYVHDFPVLQDTPNTSRSPEHNPTHTPFSRGLLEVMLSLGLTKKFTTPYRHFDFSSSAEVRLIATTQGVWKGFDKMEQGGGGLCALAKAVQEITSPSPGSRWMIEYQGSSMSKCSDNWLAQFYGAAAGIRPRAWFRPNIKRPAALPANTADLPVKIVYPTMDEIRNSHLGEPGGGTIFCRRDMWQSASRGFASLFHRGQSKRDRVAAHTKTMVALRKPPRGASAAPCPPSYKHEGYIYVGSHNFGPSAWGQLEHSSDTKEPQLKCNNYELGVLVPIRGDSDAELEAKASEIATYRRPLIPYGPRDEPWIQVPLD